MCPCCELTLACSQVRSLAELSWFFLLGAGSQMVAIAIVVMELVRCAATLHVMLRSQWYVTCAFTGNRSVMVAIAIVISGVMRCAATLMYNCARMHLPSVTWQLSCSKQAPHGQCRGRVAHAVDSQHVVTVAKLWI
jgi:hypothetical protein